MREPTPDEHGLLLMVVCATVILCVNPICTAYDVELEFRQKIIASLMVVAAVFTLLGPSIVNAINDGSTLEKSIRRALSDRTYPNMDRTRLLDAKNHYLWGIYRHNPLRRWLGVNDDAFVFALVKQQAMPLFVSHPADRLGLSLPGRGIVASIPRYAALAQDNDAWLSLGFFAYWLFKASRVASSMQSHFKTNGQKALWDNQVVAVWLPDEMMDLIVAFTTPGFAIAMLDECMAYFESQQPHRIRGPWGDYLSGESAQANLGLNGITSAHEQMSNWVRSHSTFFLKPKSRTACMEKVIEILDGPQGAP